MASLLIVFLALAGLVVVHFAAKRVSGAFSELAAGLRSPSQVPAEAFEALKARVNRLEDETRKLPLEWLEAAEEAAAERTRVEQTLKRALDRIARGEDGESAIEAEAERYGLEHAPSGEEEGVLPLRESLDPRGKSGIRVAAAAKWNGMIG